MNDASKNRRVAVTRRTDARPCPICGKVAKAENSPFCSPRCADVDLHRWLGGVYAIQGTPDATEDDIYVRDVEPDEI